MCKDIVYYHVTCEHLYLAVREYCSAAHNRKPGYALGPCQQGHCDNLTVEYADVLTPHYCSPCMDQACKDGAEEEIKRLAVEQHEREKYEREQEQEQYEQWQYEQEQYEQEQEEEEQAQEELKHNENMVEDTDIDPHDARNS